jgi:predicted ATPase
LCHSRNAAALAEVCRRLDGIPLAIELAAARVRVLSVEQIAARLADRFQLLTTGPRTALPRQQTLRALIDWSYDLLSPSERALLRGLSVFAGGFSLEAAEAVCEGEACSEEGDSVLDVLARLVDKSLVVSELVEIEEPGRGRQLAARYRLLETIREYAAGKRNEAGETTTIRTRHRNWYLRLVESAEPELRGPHQATWFDRLESEHDNLRVALDWSRAEGERGIEIGLRLAWRAVALLVRAGAPWAKAAPGWKPC